jgi:type IV pilus assembly protein PilQ
MKDAMEIPFLNRARLMSRPLVALLFLLQSAGSGPLTAANEPSLAMAPVSLAHLRGVSYENQKLIIKMDKEVPYRVFSLSRPPRLVIELSGTLHGDKPFEAAVDDGLLKRIRSAQFKSPPEKVTRVVLDLPKLTAYRAAQEGNQIVLQFGDSSAGGSSASVPISPKVPLNSSLDHAARDIASIKKTPDQARSLPEEISGEVQDAVTATAAARSPSKGGRRRARDLLAALPKNPVTIDFDDADMRDVVRVLSEMSGINMIHSADLRGFVSIHLDQVPFNEAFNTILAMQGLVAQQMGDNILRILTPEALNADRAKSVMTYKTYLLNYTKAADVMQHLAAVKISPNAKVTVDERGNALVVTDTPEGLAAAERLIGELDRKPQQVMIETKMVEIILTDDLNLGVQWEYTGFNSGDRRASKIGMRERTEGLEVDPGKVGFGVEENGEVFVENAVAPGLRGTGVALPGPQDAAITFGFINNTDLLTVTLNALAEKGHTRVLSSPKIVTLNNQEAKIQVGSKIPYETVVVSATGQAVRSTSFIDVGILLTVTPTINADNRVRLKVAPESSFPGNVGPLGPEINTRNAMTEVLIRDGETLVIGGLIDETTVESARKVPLLGDIPVLGVFFRNTSDSKRRSELLVFVTPRIVRD